jgi:DNA invertase Pin-like site-specific DNA recombinase
MSKVNGEALRLSGQGAAYIRVSDDVQDTQRQYDSIRAFEKRHGVPIAKHLWFKDEGWARDQADVRPAFQQLITLAEQGRVQWIVVDKLDRFGAKNSKQLIVYIYRLEEAGCKLYDSLDNDWTAEDMATPIITMVEGEKSKAEQRDLSYRNLGAKVSYARDGEWQGGPVRLGFDVACYQKGTKQELWRVVFEGLHKRLKVYPDGHTERFDGKGNFPVFQWETEVLRLAPSKDRAKIAAAVGTFQRYAAESVSFTALAHSLNERGFRNSYGGYFQSHHVEGMLEDPIYLGYYTFNRRHFGKFHRFTDNRVTALEKPNYQGKQSRNANADWVQSRERLFEPLVKQTVWEAVQRKLSQRSRRVNAPRSSAQYLAGLVYCANCGCRMVTGSSRKPTKNPRIDGFRGERHEFFCGSYFKAVRYRFLAKKGKLKDGQDQPECKCLRNGVFQDVLEPYLIRYLEETGQRLHLLTQGSDEDDPRRYNLIDRETEHWWEFQLGLERLKTYLRRHHPKEYQAILTDSHSEDATEYEFIMSCVDLYQSTFDPAKVATEIQQLEAEHTALVELWNDLPTARAKEKAKEKFEAVEARIDHLRRQQEDVAEVVASHYQELLDVQEAISAAERAMQSEAGERALRQRAEALRGIIQRIECTFAATGQTGAGWGKKNTRLVKVTIYPVVGAVAEYRAEEKGLINHSSEWALEYHTVPL